MKRNQENTLKKGRPWGMEFYKFDIYKSEITAVP